MEWTDTVLTTPTIGLLWEPWFVTALESLAALEPTLAGWRKQGQKLEVASDAPLALVVRSSSGFTISVDAENVVCQFSYPAEIRERANDVPHIYYAVPVRPFSELLAELNELVGEVVHALNSKKPRSLKRYGLVAAAHLDGRAPVPGVAALLEHCATPWGIGSLTKCGVHITATLSEQSTYTDRCHHRLDYNTDREHDLRCTLDWQRYYTGVEKWPQSRSASRSFVSDCSDAATAYFRTFGEGDLRYGSP